MQMQPNGTNRFFALYDKYKVAFWLGLIIIQQAILLFTMDGTGDDGDSVNHYLHNRYVFEHPWLLIHSWAKPVFVLTSCLFTLFGFWGIKLFNSIAAISAAYLAYRLAKKLNLRFPELVMPLLMFMPNYLSLSLSGLTEPLFSLMAIGALLLLANGRVFWAAILISFLPFSRPEGLFFIAIASVYFLFKREWLKYIPVLLFGHLFYTLLGVFLFEQDWNWVFATNPNAELNPIYGKTGTWLRYIKKLLYIQGLPIYILFLIGSIFLCIELLKNIKSFKEHLLPAFLITATFSVIIAHTIFWKFGLFKSFGLSRNLLTVAPYMAILALLGLQTIEKTIRLGKKSSRFIISAIVLFILIFPYGGS